MRRSDGVLVSAASLGSGFRSAPAAKLAISLGRLGLASTALGAAIAVLAFAPTARADDAKAGAQISIGGGGASASAEASGDKKAAPSAAGGSMVAVANPAAYAPELQKGIAAYTARDFPGAVQAFQAAVTAAPNDPLRHYFLGEAQLAAGNLTEAEASWSSGLRFVKNDDSLQAKLLFVVADLRERQGKWAEAKQAWADYGTFVTSHPQAKGYAATATERQKRIDVHNEMEAKYAPVRQRIQDRLKAADQPPADTGPQGPKGKPPAAGKKK